MAVGPLRTEAPLGRRDTLEKEEATGASRESGATWASAVAVLSWP